MGGNSVTVNIKSFERNTTKKDIVSSNVMPQMHRDPEIQETVAAVKMAQAALTKQYSTLLSHQAGMSVSMRSASNERSTKLAIINKLDSNATTSVNVTDTAAQVEELQDDEAKKQKVEAEQEILKLSAQKQQAVEDAKRAQQDALIAKQAIARKAKRTVDRQARLLKKQRKEASKAIDEVKNNIKEDTKRQKEVTKAIIDEVKSTAKREINEVKKRASRQVDQANRKAKALRVKNGRVNHKHDTKVAANSWHTAATKAESEAKERAEKSDAALAKAVRDKEHAHKALANATRAKQHSKQIASSLNNNTLVDILLV